MNLFLIVSDIIFRTILSAIHFNYNLKRENKLDDGGKPKVTVTYQKFKEGEPTVTEVKVEQNYGNYISLLSWELQNTIAFCKKQ